MKKIFFVSIFMLTIWMFIGVNAAEPFNYRAEDFYPLDANNEWVYLAEEGTEESIFRLEVIGQNYFDGLPVIEVREEGSDGDYFQFLFFDREGLNLVKKFLNGERNLFKPAITILPNLEIGESKVYQSEILFYDQTSVIQKIDIRMEIKLESVEEVSVLAGNFKDCLNFSYSSDYIDGDLLKISQEGNIWFAPGVGRVKQSFAEVNFEDSRNVIFANEELSYAFIDGKVIGSLSLIFE